MVSLSVGLSVTIVSRAKTAELIEMPFGLWTWVGPGNHVLDGSLDPPKSTPRSPYKGAILKGQESPIAKYRDCLS